MQINRLLIKSNKAQASAPFEVLVAVILMGFVILAGTWALINLSQSTCIGNKREKMSELKEAIKEVVMGSELTIKNISFDIQPCFNERYEYINLITYSNQTKCTAYCGGGNTCTLLEYYYDDEKTKKQPIPPICVELPTAVEYETSTYNCFIEGDPEAEKWVAINPESFETNLKQGKYQLFMKSTLSSNGARQMCFLKRNRGV